MMLKDIDTRHFMTFVCGLQQYHCEGRFQQCIYNKFWHYGLQGQPLPTSSPLLAALNLISLSHSLYWRKNYTLLDFGKIWLKLVWDMMRTVLSKDAATSDLQISATCVSSQSVSVGRSRFFQSDASMIAFTIAFNLIWLKFGSNTWAFSTVSQSRLNLSHCLDAVITLSSCQ